jgi:hypothetical protein
MPAGTMLDCASLLAIAERMLHSARHARLK